MEGSTSAAEPLLDVRDLTIDFGPPGGGQRAVDGVSFDLAAGETLAVVGESGSGKSVTALSLARLLPDPPECRVGGRILFRGRDLLQCSPREIRRYRGGQIGYVFQEPSTSFNPVFTIGDQIGEAIRLHRPDVTDVRAEIIRVLDLVGIRDPERRWNAYPHQLSGGMQQRAMIAMVVACQPKLMVADEPTTALDVTIQAQIIDLLADLRARLGMSIMLITHNFGIVSGFADRVIVMFRGRIVEAGPVARVLGEPRHPYTRALLACVPRIGQQRRRLATIDYAAIEREMRAGGDGS